MAYALNFADSVVAVTGGSSGIGRATVEAFLEAGARVAGLDRAVADVTDQLREKYPERYRAIEVDVTDDAALARARAEVESGLGAVDIIVNCAGIIAKQAIEDLDMDTWDRVHEVNLKGPVRVIQAFLPHLKQSAHGRIINISSMTALIGLETYAPYSTSKAAVSNLTKVLGVELAPHGITVNAICPGWVKTPMTEAALISQVARIHAISEAEAREKVFGLIPQHRFVQPEEIAFSVLYLASPLAGAVTGTEIRVDGGITNSFAAGVFLPGSSQVEHTPVAHLTQDDQRSRGGEGV